MSDIERRLAAAGAAWRAEQPAIAKGCASRRMSRWLPAAAAAAVVALALAATALPSLQGNDHPAPRPAHGSGSWSPMSASPLSPRLRPTMVGWGDSVVVAGGRIEPPCPPNASCAAGLRESQRDGAMYDVPSDTWQQLPDAPLPLDVTSSAVLDDVLYLWVADAGISVLALDLLARTWSTLPPPPVVGDHLRLVAAGDRLIAAYGGVGRADALDLAYDPGARRWEPLPVAPFAPTHDRSMVWTGDRLVLVTPSSPEAGPPFMRAAVLQHDTWRELPPQETVIFGSTDWSWTGTRVVSATTYEADGGQTNGFDRPYPSGGFLDPVTGRWSELPASPESHQRVIGVPYAAGGRWVGNGEGLVLDTREMRWVEPPPQPDAPDQDASSAWAAGRLIVWGGAAGVQPAGPDSDGTAARLLASGAAWTPPSR